LASTPATKVSSIVGITVLVLLLDLLFVFYVTSHGFNATSNQIMVSDLSIQLQWLPVIGVVIVSLVGWYEVFARIFPRWAGPELDLLARLRLVRVVALSIAVFVCVLYLPYLLGSNWFWEKMSHLSRDVSQFRGFGNWLLNLEMPLLTLDPIWQYSITQILASGVMVIFAWVFARPIRRVKKFR
jgi:hypothetical protein